MNSTEYIKLFESTMKKYLKRAKLRQVYLASMLNISPSAVSQMIKCRISMSRAQLHTICEGLKLSRDEALEMQTLLTRIRDGESDYRTPFNRFMTMKRREHKLSFQRLSQLTKISSLRLRSFEKDINVDFTYEDAEKIGKVYNCTTDFLMQKLSFGPRSIEYLPVASTDDSVIEVADSGAEYETRQKIQTVRLKDFSEFSDNADLFTFAKARSFEEIFYDLGKEGVAIAAEGREIGINVPGEMILFVTDKKPMSYVCRMLICMDSAKKCRLVQRKDGSDKLYEVTSDGSWQEVSGKLRWALAIIEMKFVPRLLI